MTKRHKFILTAGILSLGFLLIQLTSFSWRYLAIAFLAVLTYWLSAWSLREGLNGIEWLTVLILPTLFTTGIGLFYFLLPSSWLARLPVILIYGLGIYILLLTENIFSVGAIRTIQLVRSAQAVGFLLTLVTTFFLYDTVFSFRFHFWFNFIVVFLVSLPLFLQGLWSVRLEEKISPEIWQHSLVFSLLLAELALALSFWPLTVSVASLALITGMYVVLGLSQYDFSERLFKRTIREYLEVGLLVLVVIFLTTHWGG